MTIYVLIWFFTICSCAADR